MYLFQNLRVRDQVLTSTPSYFADDEVELCFDSDSDENDEPSNELAIVEIDSAEDPIDHHLP